MIDENTILQLNEMNAKELLSWALLSHGNRSAIITSFQKTGCIMIDMAREVAPELRVVTIDTLRLHPETYELMTEVEKRYGISIERFTPDPNRLRRMVEAHGEYLFFDSRYKQEYCCDIRKVEPNRRALQTVDVWITGLRRDQSEQRKETPKASLVQRDGREIVRLCPLADWDENDMEQYISANKVPVNALYSMGYPSIGCIICSTPTMPHEDKRAGRWRWFNYMGKEHAKECGIHIQGDGI